MDRGLPISMMRSNKVLYWPRAKQWERDGALLVGWVIEGEHLETTIVIGCVPASFPTQQLQDISSRICCCCCGTGSDRTQRQESVRYKCFEEEKIVVVGTTPKWSRSRGQDPDPFAGLPQIDMADHDDRLPVLSHSERVFDQVVLYDQSSLRCRSFVLYCHRDSTAFSNSILLRLNHSFSVMETLKNCALDDTKNIDRSSLDRQPTTSEEEEPTSPPDDSSSFLAGLVNSSLFLRHILRSSSRSTFTNPASSGRCMRCHRSIPLLLQESHYETVERWTVTLDRFIKVFLEYTLLVALVAALYHWGVGSVVTNLYQAHYALLTVALRWLENFPIGLKLNKSFTIAIGREVQRSWDVHEWTTRWIFQGASDLSHSTDSFLTLTASVGLIWGASGVLTLFLDVYRLLFLHLAVFSWISRHLYAIELQLLGASWRLFRGKKLNPLRQRTDSMEYDSMQLLLGTVLFVTVLFMFTTILAYQVLFAILHAGFAAAGSIPMGFVYVMLHGPWGRVFLRLLRPGLFCCDVLMEEVDVGSDCSCTRLTWKCAGVGGIVVAGLKSPFLTLISSPVRIVLDSITNRFDSPKLGISDIVV